MRVIVNKTLLEIATQHKTDKVEIGYIPYYDKHFSPLRNKKLNILEIGIKRETETTSGACSLRTWKDYFHNSNIYGIDIDPKNKEYEQERIEIFIGNQADGPFLNEVIKKVGKFDIIIDDGSHVNTLTLESWKHLFPHLKSGGIYVIEDMVCSYQNLDDFQVRKKASMNKHWWGMHLLPETVSYNNNRKDLDNFFAERIFNMDIGANPRWRDFYGASHPELESITFYSQLCFMEKK